MYIHELKDKSFLDNSILTFGNFDGIHLGHMQLINKLLNISNQTQVPNVFVTFKPHTNITLRNNINFKILTPLKNKIKILKSLNINYFCLIDFDIEFSKLSADEFIELLINKYNPSCIIFGYDNYFGYKKIGSYQYLKDNMKYKDIRLIKVDQFYLENAPVKTSIIKNLINDNDIDLANKYLNRKYKIFGKVIHGKKMGTNLGFPTANIEVSKEQIIPGNGVYSVNLILGRKIFVGVCNIGICPTLKNDSIKTVEIHIIDRLLTLYDENVSIEFNYFIRNEIKFDTVEGLKKQIMNDIKFVANERISEGG